MAEGRRVITLVGPAGIGKTRLAVEYVRRRRRTGGPERVWASELAGAVDRGDLCRLVATSLRLPAAAGLEDAVAQLGAAIAARLGSDRLRWHRGEPGEDPDVSEGLPEDLDALEAELDPAARYVVLDG